MKKFGKPFLALALGIVAVTAIAVPAAATSSVWLREGEPLTEHIELSLTGGEVIEVGSSALLCENTATLTTSGGSSAEITAYSPLTATCVGLSGELEGCEVTSASAANLPLSVSLGAEDLTASGFAVTYTFDAGCAISELEASAAALTLTPEEPSAIRLFHFHQEMGGKVDGVPTTLIDSGLIQVSEAEFGRYGIG